MPVITLPDGSRKPFDHAVTVADIAASIGTGLARAALAGKVNDKLVDLSFTVEHDAAIAIITDKDAAGLEVIRHSTAHLLAHAVKSLFPTAQVTIGPVIEDGFYYDFAFTRPFTPDDLTHIEAKMAELAKQDIPVSRSTLSRDEAIRYFRDIGETYKAEIIEAIPAGETLSLYTQADFTDLCRGPHVPTTGKLAKAFKLTRLAGAYWRGDSRNEMLQRIYGTAWADKKSLDAYLTRLEEAEKRDHRKIGKALDLFHFQEEAPGMVFWHADGWAIYQTIKKYISQRVSADGYEEIVTPQLVDLSLWKKSGHWDMFSNEMFTVEADDRQFALKPMNCPCHVQVFKDTLHSYRDLPVRYAEFGCVHRNEMSGAMHGLMRVRQLTQDDGHIFCMENQIQAEAGRFIRTLSDVYRDFGFNDLVVRLATRPEKRLGSDAIWDNAEKALADALTGEGVPFELLPGEGAFYGPKIEFHLRDSIGRQWQCGTLQIDYSQPDRLGAYYIAEDSSKQVPVMLHRAITGSLERFIGILLEHYAGKLPLWLAPTQLVIMNITDRASSFTSEIASLCKKNGIRVKSDLRNEKIGYKIRQHTLQCVPLMAVVGDREVETRSVSLRTRDGEDKGSLTLDQLLALINTAIAQKGRVAETSVSA